MNENINTSEDIKKALGNLSEVVALQDGRKNAIALKGLIKIAKNDNLDSDDVFELIQETGLGGRENLRGFIEREFEMS
ncbi:hypothetical protein N9W34_03450 [Rickettsiales bacterium]|nr:hypothetical protein [Rickettsiales bacterium]